MGSGGIKFRFGSRRNLKSKSAKSIAARKYGKTGGIIFFGIFALVGGILTYFFALKPAIGIINARSWTETPCKIISASVQSHRGDDGTTYSIQISYEYQFNGQTCQSDRYSFMGGSSSGHSGKQAVVDRYRKDKNPVCFVNPDNPREAVLVRGFEPIMLIGLMPMLFLLIGVGGIVGVLKGKKSRIISKASRGKSVDADWLPETKTAETDEDNIYASMGTGASGPVILRASSSRLSKLIFLIIFSAFWNGIVSVFVVQVVKSFQRGRPEWGLTIFISIFVAIGIGTIFGVLYQFLAMFNPRAKLTLSSADIPLGSTPMLTWEIVGAVNRISELVITLNAREECRYRRGTKTYTDKHTFFETELTRTTDPIQMAYGQVGFAIPEDTMHSFTASSNKIIWSLKVEGDIKKWPDVKDEFDITITPQQM